MRRSRILRLTAIAIAAFAAVLVVPGSASTAGATTSAPAATSTADADAVTTADVTAATSGLCSVPGIGDIGGLFGFCAAGSSGVLGALNNVCQPSLPNPEPASAGIDAMIAPPASGKPPATLYDQYGIAGDYWAATNLQCSDMTSLIGNNVAGMVFDAAKSIDRVTITVYQSAAGEGILSWLQRVTDKLITSLGNAIYFPYLAVVIILAAIWLAWQGLIRKRATRTIEGTVWMVAACAAAIFLIGKPADVTGIGRGLSDGISQALNAAFAKLPSPGPAGCVPVHHGDPQVQPATYSYTSGSTVVDQNADELWTVLVCKPWLVGEFGTSVYSTGSVKPTVVNSYGRALLWSQAIAVNEKVTPALVQAKQDAYAGIATSLQANAPSVYPLFQGKQWTTRLEVAFAALFAAVVAGMLVLLLSVTLILLKLSFLLLLIVGPFFLLIGAHPGFGRVVALRWVELLIGVLLKQAALALVLSVLLYCYALIMGTSDAVLPWALKILMISLVTVAAFIYRKPFQHLFSAVGYGMIGSQDRAEAELARSGATARANTLAAATMTVPPFAAYRAARWARRNPGQAASLAMAATSGGAAAVAAGLQAGEAGTGTAGDGTAGEGTGLAATGTVASGVPSGEGTGRLALAARARAGATLAAPATGGEPPPLNLPSRNGGPGTAAGAAVGGSALTASAATPAVGSTLTGSAATPGVGGAAAPGAGATAASRAAAPARAAAPGAWPMGRGVGPSSQGSQRQSGPPPLRQPAAPARQPAAPPRQPSAPPARWPSAPSGSATPQPSRTQPAAAPVSGGAAPRSQRLRPQLSARGQPTRGQPAQRQPAPRESAQGQPVQGQPARGQPAQGQPARGQPAQRLPAPAQQAGGRRPWRSPPEPAPSQQPRAQASSRDRRFWRSGAGASNRQPAERQPAERQPAERQPAERQPGVQMSTSRRPVDRQRGGREPAQRQRGGHLGGQSAGNGRAPVSGPPPQTFGPGSSPGDQPALWQGQTMTGPLASRPAEPEPRTPFWLRPWRK